MTINAAYILAGINGAGSSGAELAWFAPTGSTAPSDATTALDVAFKSAGLISDDGVSKSVKNNSKDVTAFGLASPVRKIVTSEEVNLKLTFLETNKISAAIYNRLALDAVTVTAGAFSTTEGTFRSQRYACVFDVVDNLNHIRMYCPSVEVTDRGDLSVKAGDPIQYEVTLTAYPGSDGVAIQTFYVVTGLT